MGKPEAAAAITKGGVKKVIKKPRSTEGAAEAKAAAKMTKEEWQEWQVEEWKQKFPKPAYMATERPTGETSAYRDQKDRM